MKKLLALFLASIMIISLTACTSSSENNENSKSQEAASSESNQTVTADDAKWKQFIRDYEAWADDYVQLVKKYKDNPTDLSILSEYTKTVSDLATWSEKAKEIELELKDTSAALEFSTELLRIAEKLTKVAN